MKAEHPSDWRWEVESPVYLTIDVIEPPERKKKKKGKKKRRVPFGFARALLDADRESKTQRQKAESARPKRTR